MARTREEVQAGVTIFNQAIDVIYNDNASEGEKQRARDAADSVSQLVSASNGVCGCNHPLYLQLGCPVHDPIGCN